VADLPRIPSLGSGEISSGDINASVGKLTLHSGALDIDFTPTVGVIAADLNRLGIDIRSYREPLSRVVRQVMIPSIKANFDAEGRPDKWAELSEFAIDRRGSAHPILQVTGRLYQAAQQLNNWVLDQTQAVFTSLPDAAWYGALHQNGYSSAGIFKRGTRPQGAQNAIVPARPFIMFQDADEEKIDEVFADWFMERARAVGRFV
jgi:phage gpG-like protein